MAACELWIMFSQTTEQMATAMRWMHAPVAVTVVALIGFVRVYLRAGRPWLAWAAAGTRLLRARASISSSPRMSTIGRSSRSRSSRSSASWWPFLMVCAGPGCGSLRSAWLLLADRSPSMPRLRCGAAASGSVRCSSAAASLLFVFWVLRILRSSSGAGRRFPSCRALFFMGIIVAMGYGAESATCCAPRNSRANYARKRGEDVAGIAGSEPGVLVSRSRRGKRSGLTKAGASCWVSRRQSP